MLFDKKKNTDSVKIDDSLTRELIEKINEEIKSVGISLEDAIYIHEVYKSSPQKKEVDYIFEQIELKKFLECHPKADEL